MHAVRTHPHAGIDESLDFGRAEVPWFAEPGRDREEVGTQTSLDELPERDIDVRGVPVVETQAR